MCIRDRINTVRITEENCRDLFKDDDIICEAFDKPDVKAMLTEQMMSSSLKRSDVYKRQT